VSKRGELPIPSEPMRACEQIIAICRSRIDSPFKRNLRSIINFCLRHKNRLSEIGEGFQLGVKTSVPVGSRLGRYAYIGKGFSAPSPVCIGDLCMISTRVTIIDNDHGINNVDLPIRLDFRWEHKITVFEGDVWVGHGAIIRSGVRIGRGAVIASGAVVTKSIEPYSVVGGNPARLIRKRFTDSEIAEHDELIYGKSFFPS